MRSLNWILLKTAGGNVQKVRIANILDLFLSSKAQPSVARYEVEVSVPDSLDISCPVRIIHGLKVG